MAFYGIFILLALPVISGVMLLWARRRDRRRQVIQRRLQALTVGPDDGEPAPRLSLQQRIRRAPAPVFRFHRQLRARLDTAFEATGNSVGLPHLIIAGLAGALLAMLFTSRILALNPALTLLLTGIAATAAPAVLLCLAQSRYQKRFLDVFPDALDLVRRGVKAGLPVNEALAEAGREIADPVGYELRRVLDQVQIGVPMIDAMQEAFNRVRVADFRFLVVTLALQQKSGGSLAETLANLSGVIRARKALRLKARALSSEAKASAMVLAALPFVMCGIMYVMNRELVLPLFVDPRGRLMLGVAFLSLVTGLGSMAVIIKRAVR
jgi:tight adherence protein B